MTIASLNPSLMSAISLLGGEAVLRVRPRVLMDWIPLVRQGLPAASVDALLRLTRITQAELANALAIPERTMARRKREGALSPEESAKLVRFARTVERAETVFDDAPAALAWLQSPNAALGGVTPMSLLDTDIGADSVLDTLGRIEHGVFAWCRRFGVLRRSALLPALSAVKARACTAGAGIPKAGRWSIPPSRSRWLCWN